MLKAILFDLDNTLIWDDKSINASFKATCKLAEDKYNIDPAFLEEKVKENARELYATADTYAFTKEIGISPFEVLWGDFADEGDMFRELHQFAPAYQKMAWTNGLREMGINDEGFGNELAETFPVMRKKMPFVYDDTFRVLNQLHGKYQLLLLTNGSPDLQQTKLRLTPKLAPYFDQIVVSGAFGKGKPDPTIFAHALDLLGIDHDEAIMVGDNLMTDILGASKAGIDSVWVNHNDTKLSDTDVKPTHEISSLTELLKWDRGTGTLSH